MNRMNAWTSSFVALVLTACVADGGSGDSESPTYTVGGMVSGVAGSGLVLQNSSGDNLTVTEGLPIAADGSFTFKTSVIAGKSYSVAAQAQPSNPSQTCLVASGDGTIGSANVTNVVVTCTTNSYTVGGTVSGLVGSGLVLKNSDSNDLAISSNGQFTFSAPVVSGGAYEVTVSTQPTNPTQTCAVTSGAGNVGGSSLTSVDVSCTTNTYSIGGTVTGLVGTGLALQNNGGDDLAISANGMFEFAAAVFSGGTYNVSIATQPTSPIQACEVIDYSGSVSSTSVADIVIKCAAHWTWVSGSKFASEAGTYGTKGAANASNVPGARRNSVSWSDSNGNLWLFGGNGADASGIEGALNDLWKFDGSNWIWVNGSSLVQQYGIYGTKGVVSASNVPGARENAVSWIDASNNLWLFGGKGYDISGALGELNDLWKFDGSNWTWIAGANYRNSSGTYGTRGVGTTNNIPGARDLAVGWSAGSNTFWLFGGIGIDGANVRGHLNDLWKFDGSNWIWMSGSANAGQQGSYGTRGVPASNNVPGARLAAVGKIDSNGNLLLFGGVGNDGFGASDYLNDLWKFDGTNWTWVSGSNAIDQPGNYGTLAITDNSSTPGARYGSAIWIDVNDHLWVFGGYGADATGTQQRLNDLWMFDGTNWTWMDGSNSNDTSGVYGSKGVAAPSNVPGSRDIPVSWQDGGGKFWLFGGSGYDSNGVHANLNDLWSYQP